MESIANSANVVSQSGYNLNTRFVKNDATLNDGFEATMQITNPLMAKNRSTANQP